MPPDEADTDTIEQIGAPKRGEPFQKRNAIFGRHCKLK
jgi:hypothetical protein